MTRNALLSFSKQAAEARLELYGEDAVANGDSFKMACTIMTDLELAAGGYERAGQIRGITTKHLQVSDRVEIRGKKWKVVDVRQNVGSVESSVVLEPLQVR